MKNNFKMILLFKDISHLTIMDILCTIISHVSCFPFCVCFALYWRLVIDTWTNAQLDNYSRRIEYVLYEIVKEGINYISNFSWQLFNTHTRQSTDIFLRIFWKIISPKIWMTIISRSSTEYVFPSYITPLSFPPVLSKW